MRFEGRLVEFNDKSYNVLTKESKILYLNKDIRNFEGYIPFVWEWDANNIIGYIDKIKFGKCYISVSGKITNEAFIDNVIKKERVTNIGLGGLYAILESHMIDKVRVLDIVDLRYISTRLDCEKDCKRVITKLED